MPNERVDNRSERENFPPDPRRVITGINFPNASPLKKIGFNPLTPHRLFPSRKKEPYVFGYGSLIPNLKRFETKATLLFRSTYTIPSYLSTMLPKIRTRPKEGSKKTLNLPNNLLGQNKQRRPINLHREQNGLDKLGPTSIREQFIGPAAYSFSDFIYKLFAISCF